jgi:hypothetical protein
MATSGLNVTDWQEAWPETRPGKAGWLPGRRGRLPRAGSLSPEEPAGRRGRNTGLHLLTLRHFSSILWPCDPGKDNIGSAPSPTAPLPDRPGYLSVDSSEFSESLEVLWGSRIMFDKWLDERRDEIDTFFMKHICLRDREIVCICPGDSRWRPEGQARGSPHGKTASVWSGKAVQILKESQLRYGGRGGALFEGRAIPSDTGVAGRSEGGRETEAGRVDGAG